jgi:hypothetical protein
VVAISLTIDNANLNRLSFLGLYRLRKKLSFVSGHDFSRAAND